MRREMFRKTSSRILVVLILIGMLTSAVNIQPAGTSGAIYIMSDGSISPSTASIQCNGEVYVFTDNVFDSIIVEKDNIIIDGAGFAVQGVGNGTGIILSERSNVTVKNVKIKAFHTGIFLASSLNNTLFRNNITGNVFGIAFQSSYGNVIYHNNFINNSRQVFDAVWEEPGNYTPSLNIWDHDYPLGGNHWSDCAGCDEKRGESQDLHGSDGIGDTQYAIDGSNRDNYPLMKPYAGSHDIGITKAFASKTIVGQGYETIINATIVNYGEQPETFNITFQANTIAIQTKTITLTHRNSTDATFTWNTSNFAYNKYAISVYAWPMSGEEDKTDNTHKNATVLISIPGDVLPVYGLVDIRDIGTIVKIFGSTPENSEWEPNADIDGNSKVDMKDVGMTCKNFGKTNNGVYKGWVASETSPARMSVTVSTGVGVINGESVRTLGDTEIALEVADSEFPRRDLIVIDGEGVLDKVTGVPSATPLLPTVSEGKSVLAEIWVSANTTAITNNNITDCRVMTQFYLDASFEQIALAARQKVLAKIDEKDAETSQWVFYEENGTYYVKDENGEIIASGTSSSEVWNGGMAVWTGEGSWLVKDRKTYVFDGTIEVKSHVKIKGEFGHETVLRLGDLQNSNFIVAYTTPVSDIVFENICIDINRQGQTIDQCGVEFTDAFDIYFYKVKFVNRGDSCVFINKAGSNPVCNIYFVDNIALDNQGTSTSPDFYVTGYSVDQKAEEIYFINNEHNGTVKLGVKLANKVFCYGNNISDSERGLTFRGVENLVIAKNTVINVSTSGINEAGIWLESPYAMPITDIVIYDNEVRNSQCYGIASAWGAVYNATFILNTSTDNVENDFYVGGYGMSEILNLADSQDNLYFTDISLSNWFSVVIQILNSFEVPIP